MGHRFEIKHLTIALELGTYLNDIVFKGITHTGKDVDHILNI